MKIFKKILGIIALLFGIGILFELLPVPNTFAVGLVYLALGIEFIANTINSIDD